MEIKIDPDRDSVENLRLLAKVLDAKIVDRKSDGRKRVKDSVGELEKTLMKLEAMVGKTIPVCDILDEMKKKKVSEEAVESALEHLMTQGKIIEPRIGFIQRVEDESD